MTKLDFSKPDKLQTRDGRQVRIYATDGACSFCIHGATLTERGWEANRWDNNGRYINDKIYSQSDLIRKHARIKGWMNVYPDGVTGHVSADRGECKKNAGMNCLGQIYIDAEVQE